MTPPRRRYIRRESKTRSKTNRLYKAKAEVWKVGKRCAFPGCGKRKVECHHTRGRAGSLLMDERFWLPLCARHHVYVHEHSTRAREFGLLCEHGKWNTPDL